MQWDLIAAAVEPAVIRVLNLGKEDVERMKGRSRVTFINETKRLLRDIADEDVDADLLTRAKWLRAAAGHHTRMPNKLIMFARYMKNKTGDAHRTADMRLLSYKIAVAYKELAGKLSKMGKLSQIQNDQSQTCWMNKVSKQKRKGSMTH